MFASSPLQPVLPVVDLDRAKIWYSEKLGLDPMMEDQERGMAVYENAGSLFLLYVTEFAGSNRATAAGFIVDDFDNVVSQLRANGVQFDEVDFGDGISTVDGVIASPDGTEKGAWFRDSEGNVIGLSTPPST